MSNSVYESLRTLFSSMEEHVSTKTVVGDPVKIGDVLLVPLVDVVFGMGTGLSLSSDTDEKKGRDGGGGAMGAKMTPAAVVVISNGTVQLVNVKNQESVNKMIDMIPGILSKLGLGTWLDRFINKDKAQEGPGSEASAMADNKDL